MAAPISKRPVGRPRKYPGGGIQMRIAVPADLRAAVEAHRERKKFVDLPETARDLLRIAAEQEGLIERRK